MAPQGRYSKISNQSASLMQIFFVGNDTLVIFFCVFLRRKNGSCAGPLTRGFLFFKQIFSLG